MSLAFLLHFDKYPSPTFPPRLVAGATLCIPNSGFDILHTLVTHKCKWPQKVGTVST